MFVINLGEHKIYDKNEDRTQFVQEKIDTIMLAGRLMGYRVQITNMLYNNFIRIVFESDRGCFMLSFHIDEDNSEFNGISLDYLNNVGYLRNLDSRLHSANRKSIRYILKKAEYIL